jgi:farnesyl diphosphate synthase
MSRVAGIVEQALESLMPPVDGAESRLVDAMRYATLGGGKRLRAFLVMETAHLFSVSETCAARVAAAVEMLHAYSLVHDDLPAMDDDDLRRGKASTHKAFDEATAILAGDALQTRAFEVLAEPDTHSDPEARCELVLALGAAAGDRRTNPGRPGGDPTTDVENRAFDSVQCRGRGDSGESAAPATASGRGVRARPGGGVPDRR